MIARLIFLVGLLWLSGAVTALAQVPDFDLPNGNWWRNCASLDMDFLNDRYYINSNTTCDGTTGSVYSGATYGTNINNFITATGATFTRAGTNVTNVASPFYLTSPQSFVSRASVTNNVTSTIAPFYTNASQSWVSRSSSASNITSTAAPFYMTTAGESFVSRASSATYFNSSGVLTTASSNTARNATYSYNGTSWVANTGTLIEPAATNLVTYSNGSGSETKGSTSNTTYVDSGTVGLDGSTDYMKCTDSTAASGSLGQVCRWKITYSASTSYAVSMYVMAAGRSAFTFFVSDGTSNGLTSTFVNLAAGTVTSTTPNCASLGSGVSSIQAVGNNVYRVSLTFTTSATPSGGYFDIRMSNSTTYPNSCIGPPAYTGDGASGIDVWGVQLEAGTTATSYIATSGSTATRAADVYSIQPASYFDSTGTLQYAAASTARNAAYTYSGSAWVAQAANTLSPQTISSITDSSGTATVTTGSAHGLAVGNSVTLSGNYPSNYNGTFTVTSVPSTTTFTYTMTTDPGVSAAQIGVYTTTATTPAVLIGPTATNSFVNSLMTGAVAADGAERTVNGTFSATSPSVCSGSITSSSNSLSCANGMTVTAQTISSITYSGTTATMTTAAAHGLAVGNVVTVSGASPSAYNGTFMVVSVPSSTKITYTMFSTPTANATVTSASYTATLGGWAGTLNGGAGSVAAASGSMTLTGDGTNAASVYEEIPTISGYLYTITVTTGSGNAVTVQADSYVGASSRLSGAVVAASSTVSYQFTAGSATSYVQINNTSATAATLTSVSVQSAGLVPTGINFITGTATTSMTATIVGTGTESGMPYIDVKFAGTPLATSDLGIECSGSCASIAVTPGQSWTESFYVRETAGSTSNLYGFVPEIIWRTSGGNIVSRTDGTIFAPVTTGTMTQDRYTVTGTVPATTSYLANYLRFYTSASGAAINITFRFGGVQLEQSAYATSLIPTASAAVTRSADVYNQQPASYFDGTGTLNFTPANTARTNHNTTSPYASLGTLIEPAATNSFPNSMLVGAVAADGIERTINGAFSTTSPNVCSGTNTSSGNGLSCSSGTAVTAQTISSIAYSSTTATVTTATAHNLTVGNIVTMSGVGGTSATSFNGTFMIVSVPSSTTFTYTMVTAPSTAAIITGASYTATVGGWAGTVNGGAGTVAGASGSMTLTGDGTNAASVYEEIPTISGYTYTVAVTNGSGNAVTVQAGTAIGGTTLLAASTVAASTTTYYQFNAGSATSYVQINNTSATAATLTSVSVQSAGLAPTGLSFVTNNSLTNLTATIVGTGTESGMPYIDVKFAGTPLATSDLGVGCSGSCTTSIAVTPGQSWTESFYVRETAGSTSNLYGFVPEITWRTSTNTIPSRTDGTIFAPVTTGAMTQDRYTVTGTAPSTTAYLQNYFRFYTSAAGTPINITFRFGGVQIEQNAYGTSLIPTFGSAVTRTADVYNQPVGTYYNSSGVLTTAANNTPRMDHSPSGNFAQAGILIENTTTNYLPYSVLDGGTNWTYSTNNTVATAAAATAPDGTTTAATIADNSTSGSHYAIPAASVSFTSGTSYVFSVFAKASTATVLQLDLPSGEFGSTAYADFNLSAGTVSGNGSGTTSGIQALGNSWYRCYIAAAATSSARDYPAIVLTNNSAAATAEPSYTGTGKLLYAWGAQVEYNYAPTSYIPTNGTTLTRQSETFTIPTTAGGGWYNASAGTGTFGTTVTFPYAVFNPTFNVPIRLAAIDDGTESNTIEFGTDATANTIGASITAANTVYYNKSTASINLPGINKAVSSFSATASNSAINGNLLGSTSSTTIPTVSVLQVGGSGGGRQINAWADRIWYQPIYQANANSLIDYSR